VKEAAVKCAPDEVRACIEGALRSMTFPRAAAAQPVTVTIP
jgi:hypothetical protein